jgi:hypothetical protein
LALYPTRCILWDMAASLISPHEPALTVLFAEVESAVAAQREAFLGTPGTLDERSNENGTRFWVHRYSDGVGKRVETYLGKLDDPEVEARVDALRAQIESTNRTIAQVRILARAGFATVDRKSYSTLASLHNHGLFRAGALLIGSHAYGALLNALGVKAMPYKTEDVDIARREALALPDVPPFLDMLRATGIEFFEVPRVDCKAPSTSFAERGGSRLTVDLLVPSRGDDYPTVPVPELKAHAKGLPYLAYLLGQSQQIPILSPHGTVAVRDPVPERYAVHKLIVSQLRSSTNVKAEKDLKQAATLIVALVERFPGAVEEALEAVPKSAARALGRALIALERHLPETAAAAWDALARR